MVYLDNDFWGNELSNQAAIRDGEKNSDISHIFSEKVQVGDVIDFDIEKLNDTESLEQKISKYAKILSKISMENVLKIQEFISTQIHNYFSSKTIRDIIKEIINYIKEIWLWIINSNDKKLLIIYIALCIYEWIQKNTTPFNENSTPAIENVIKASDWIKKDTTLFKKRKLKRKKDNPIELNNPIASTQNENEANISTSKNTSGYIYVWNKDNNGIHRYIVLATTISGIAKQLKIKWLPHTNSELYTTISDTYSKQNIPTSIKKQYIGWITTGVRDNWTIHKKCIWTGTQLQYKIDELSKNKPDMDLAIFQFCKDLNSKSQDSHIAIRLYNIQRKTFNRYIYNPKNNKNHFSSIDGYISKKNASGNYLASMIFLASWKKLYFIHNQTKEHSREYYIPGKYNNKYLFAVNNNSRGIFVPQQNIKDYSQEVTRAKALAKSLSLTPPSNEKILYPAWPKLRQIANDKYYDAAFAVQESKVTLHQTRNNYGDHGVKQINEGDAYTEIRKHCPYFKDKNLENLEPYENIAASRILRYVQLMQFHTLKIKTNGGYQSLSKLIPKKDHKYTEALGYNGWFGTVKAVCEFNLKKEIPLTRDGINNTLAQHAKWNPNYQIKLTRKVKNKKTGKITSVKKQIPRFKAMVMSQYGNAVVTIENQIHDMNILWWQS